MTNAQSGTLHIDEATLSYDIREGTSPTIVMLHGVGSSRASEEAAGYLDWSPVSALGRRTVRYDARGHGRSTGGTQPGDYTWSHLADDLLTLLDNVAPGEVVDGIGVSMGVGTLLRAVTREPERFRRLALVLPPTAWETRTVQANAYRQTADLVDTHGADALRARVAAAPTLPLIAAGGWTFPPPDVDGSVFAAVLRGAALADFPDPDAVSRIQQPILLLPWTGDPGHPVSTSEQLHRLLPNSTIEVNSTVEDVQAIGAQVAKFLDPTAANEPESQVSGPARVSRNPGASSTEGCSRETTRESEDQY